MKFYSSRNSSIQVSLREAVFNGLAQDGGLYLPCSIPPLSAKILNRGKDLSLAEIGFEVAKQFLQPDLEDAVIREIVDEALNFPIPLVQLESSLWIAELFHGPTLAFKDVAARFMARLLARLHRAQDKPLTILVATSGDTGSAVAHGFHNVPGVRVVLLYPAGKVSALQERQFTTLGGNITALRIQGTFDDCQRLVKLAFNDGTLRKEIAITSANSISIARLIPQSFYYFYICAQLSQYNLPIVVSVPSGNYGNLCAGLIAKIMGAPIAKFVASANANDVVPQYLARGKFEPKLSVTTLSNAMDVGNPSNFDRIVTLYNNDHAALCRDVTGFSFSDEETIAAIQTVYRKYNYILCPHSAVGYLGLAAERGQTVNEQTTGVVLATAHPAKFIEVIEKALGKTIALPDALAATMHRESKSIDCPSDYEALKSFLL